MRSVVSAALLASTFVMMCDEEAQRRVLWEALGFTGVARCEVASDAPRSAVLVWWNDELMLAEAFQTDSEAIARADVLRRSFIELGLLF